MPEPKVYEFSKHIADLCATRGTDVFRLGTKLGIDPMELLQMINGKVVPTKEVISGLAKELHSAVPSHEAGRRNQTLTWLFESLETQSHPIMLLGRGT